MNDLILYVISGIAVVCLFVMLYFELKAGYTFRKALWKAISNWAKLEALRWLEREKACPVGSDREGFCMKRRHLWERVGDKGAYEVASYETRRDHLLTMYADAIASGKGIVTVEQPMRIIGK